MFLVTFYRLFFEKLGNLKIFKMYYEFHIAHDKESKRIKIYCYIN